MCALVCTREPNGSLFFESPIYLKRSSIKYYLRNVLKNLYGLKSEEKDLETDYMN